MAQDPQRSWAEVHDPATTGARLADIAAAHPEFAGAIAQHPSCYPDLAAWARSVAQDPAGRETPDATTPRRSIPRRSTPRRPLVVGGIVAVALVLVGGGVFAAVRIASTASPVAAPVPDDTMAASATPGARVLDGDPVYVGDELSWLLPTTDEVTRLIPSASAVVTQGGLRDIGELEVSTSPAECLTWIAPDGSAVVGNRGLEWNATTDGAKGRATALQFPSPAIASAYLSSFTTTASACARYDIVPGQGNSQLTVLATDATGFVAVMDTVYAGSSSSLLVALVAEGNVVVSINSVFAKSTPPDGAAVLSTLEAHAADARTRLTDKIGYR